MKYRLLYQARLCLQVASSFLHWQLKVVKLVQDGLDLLCAFAIPDISL